MSNSKPSSEKARAKNKDRKVFGFLFDKVNGLILRQQNVPAPSKGWCWNPKGLLNGTLYHPFGTPWRVQVCMFVCMRFCLEHVLITPPEKNEKTAGTQR